MRISKRPFQTFPNIPPLPLTQDILIEESEEISHIFACVVPLALGYDVGPEGERDTPTGRANLEIE